MGAQRTTRFRVAPDPAPRTGARTWLSHAVVALAVSGLGLGLAGSLAAPSSAQVPTGVTPTGVALPGTPRTSGRPAPTPAPTEDPALSSFDQPRSVTGPVSEADRALAAAVVRERAAQRREELAKAAEATARAAHEAAADARSASLAKARLAQQAEASRIAQEALDRAIAERVAAEKKAAEAAALNTTSTSTTGTPGTPGASNAPAPAPVAPPVVVPGSGGGVSPVPGAVIGAHFGQRGLWATYHTGLDFRAGQGTPIRAVKAGTVVYAGNSGDWAGNHVAVRHADGMTTMYSHMSAMAATSGQVVQAGQVIGYVGQTGRAFGAHLHFELYPVGVQFGDVYRAVDPQPWLAANGVQTR
ncbi:MAG: peptidase family protein [Friedmanniella sp.]|nr:peptidase family protein [Friedmanniella sp.]